MKPWSLIAFVLALLIAVSSAVFYYWPDLYDNFFKSRTIEYTNDYQITDLSCGLTQDCGEISFAFKAADGTVNPTPRYQIKETPEEAKTEIIFSHVSQISDNFTYEQIANNPLIEDIAYDQIGNAFILTIKRKGPLTPTQVTINGNIVILKLPFGTAEYPNFSEQQPTDQSLVFSSYKKIAVKITLSAALKKGVIYIDDIPVELQTINLENNQYLLETTQKLTYKQDYKVKAVAIDQENRASATIWEFSAEKSLAASTLGQDRFKYLGWWGQINSTSTPVMADSNSGSEQLDTFSTINRVKVLKEVDGEAIDGNDLWLQIDGGKHPGAYIHSAFVTPITQPEPPKLIKIPEEIQTNEYWIDVDVTKQILTLFLYNEPVFVTYVSTGRPANPTVVGAYRVWYKLFKTRMRGGPPVVATRYDLPNVPYVMYYYQSYGVHGTYWHDKFGTRQSSGCTNLTQGDARFIFEKTLPSLIIDAKSILSSPENPGTIVNNHY